MAEIVDLYQQWETRWLLSNPKPSLALEDQFLDILKYIMAGGAIVLAGSRTGSVVAGIGALSSFADKLGVASPLVTASEAFLAFLTFDAAILLAGYLLGDDKADERWYFVLLLFALVPSLAANVYPSFRLFGDAAVVAGTIIVDVLVGVFTPCMAFVSGRVIGATNNARKNKTRGLEEAWQAKKNAAWVRSGEYRSWVRSSKPVAVPPPTRGSNHRKERITELLRDRGALEIDSIARVIGVPESQVWADVMTMPDVMRSGSSVRLTDF